MRVLIDVTNGRVNDELIATLRRGLHEAFAGGYPWRDTDDLVAWIYRELFLMPLDDAALGLDVADPQLSVRSGPARS